MNPFLNFLINKMPRSKLEWTGRWHQVARASSVKSVDLEFFLPSFVNAGSIST